MTIDTSIEEEVLIVLEDVMVKARKIIQGCPDTKFTVDEKAFSYTCVYDFCRRRDFYNAEELRRTIGDFLKAEEVLYEKFRTGLEETIELAVLPSLVNKTGLEFLIEFDSKWSSYKAMGRLLCGILRHLERRFLRLNKHLYSLEKVVAGCFRDLVLKRLFDVLGEAVTAMVCYDALILAYCLSQGSVSILEYTAMIREQREGISVDKDLLKRVLKTIDVAEFDRYTDYGFYVKLESSFLSDLSAYYAELAPLWLMEFSALDYVTNAYKHLSIESERARDYLRPGTIVKLSQAVRFELLDQYASNLAVKVEAGSDGKKKEYEEMLSKCTGMNLEADRWVELQERLLY